MTDQLSAPSLNSDSPPPGQPVQGNRVKRHLGEIISLSTPVVLSRTGIFLLVVADFAILGRNAPDELPYLALGNSPFIIMWVICIGLLLGTIISASQAFGENNMEEVGAAWRRSLPYAFLLGCFMAVLSYFGEPFFTLTNQPEEVIAGAAEVMFILGLSIIPNTLFLTSAFFLEAIKRPMPVMLMMIACNLVNIAGNVLFVEEYGAAGVVWSTFAARCLLGIGLCLYIWFLRDHHEFHIRKKPANGWWRGGAAQRRHGYAAGISMGFETVAFGIMSIYAGWLGADALSIYGVCMNLLALCFMLGVGIATATGVRVGIAHGRKDFHDRSLAGWLGIGLTIVVLIPVAALLLLFPELVLSFYLSEKELILTASATIIVIAFINFADGGQVVIQSALRAADDKWFPTIIAFSSYIAIMLPLGYVFTQTLDFGVIGLYYAIACGSVFAFCCFTGRWSYLCLKR